MELGKPWEPQDDKRSVQMTDLWWQHRERDEERKDNR